MRPLCMLISLCAMAGVAQAATLDRVILDPAVYPDATCNDGTAPAIYVDEGSGTGASKWMIFLEGGSACNDPVSCADRLASKPALMGTGCMGPGDCDASYGVAGAVVPATRTFTGLFEDTGTDFSDWNKVYVEYCSSDTFVGQGGDMVVPGFDSEVTPNLVQFNGHHIIEAVVDTLSNRAAGKPELDDAGATVLFGGGSAGSAGARRNLDYIADALPLASDVRGLLDSAFNGGLAPDDPVSPTSCSSDLAEGTVDLVPGNSALDGWVHWDPYLDETCVTAAASAGEHPSLCLSLSYQVQNDTIDTPYFVIQAQHDHLMRGKVGENDATLTALNALGLADTLANRKQCGQDRVQSFGSAVAAAASPSPMEGWYVPCKSWHVITQRSMANVGAIGGVSFVDAIENWYSGTGSTQFIDLTCAP